MRYRYTEIQSPIYFHCKKKKFASRNRYLIIKKINRATRNNREIGKKERLKKKKKKNSNNNNVRNNTAVVAAYLLHQACPLMKIYFFLGYPSCTLSNRGKITGEYGISRFSPFARAICRWYPAARGQAHVSVPPRWRRSSPGRRTTTFSFSPLFFSRAVKPFYHRVHLRLCSRSISRIPRNKFGRNFEVFEASLWIRKEKIEFTTPIYQFFKNRRQ